VRFDHLDGEPIFVVAALGKQMIPVMVIYIQYIYILLWISTYKMPFAAG
jgi:hypothetical protein